ncbi:erythrocyte membrane protein 1, PfEMP1, putative [Plasmodium gaboni]|uniref:Erythrocyte membrane protein 1, PfEMP1, putative n=1 Tax=Plasmodium gaboni TaxID=647221 RepID=A0ABY1UQB0_9APIC|nr:erythrocyte membrane protein 1, PfEMP1, putative [Plasmodium gaboni]
MGNAESDRRTGTLEKYKDILPPNVNDWYYVHYIEYLRNTIKGNGTPWNDSNFLQLLKKHNENVPVSDDGKFCRWKEIQKEIFDAVIEHHKYDYYYPWEKNAERILNESPKTKQFENIDCNKIDTIENKTKKSQKDKDDVCSFNTTDLSSCLPSRRNNLYIDGIKSNIEITETLIDTKVQNAVVQPFFLGSLSGSLANKAKNEIKKLKSSGKTHTDICKIMQRNIADYKDLFLGKDIVDHRYSKVLQCRLDKIRKYINQQDETQYSQLLDNKIKKIVQKHLDDFIDEDGNKCTLHNMSNTDFQCLRFLEEWFEEFLIKKQNIENHIIHICVNKKSKTLSLVAGTKGDMTCKTYCDGYTKFLEGSRSCYQTYLKKCTENIRKTEDKQSGKKYDEHIATTEINNMLKKIKKKTKCPDYICKSDHEVNLSPYFVPSNTFFSLHRGYHCGCQQNNNNLKNILKRYSEKNGHTTTISELETILKELSACSMNDDDLDGTIGGKGEKLVTTNGSVKYICGVTYYDSFIRKNTGNPCGSNSIGKRGWICDDKAGGGGETVKTEWKNNACLPPRTQVLCLGYLHADNKGTTYNKIDTIDSNEKLLTELVYAANVEGQNLKKYFASRHNHRYRDHNLCNSLKYSFADLGDIVRGRSIWGNIYTKNMENNLKEIFHKIYNKLPSEKQSIYNDNNNNYYYLRETWWNTNREYIWKALVCGAGVNDDRCRDVVPNIDYMPQFLRWLTEWSGDFCEEKNTYDITYPNPKNSGDDKNIESMCRGCNADRGNDCLTSYPNVGHASSNITCSKCGSICKQYKTWMENQKKEYDKQKNKYDDEIKKSKNGHKSRSAIRKSHISDNSKKFTETFFNKIGIHYPDVNKFLDERSQHTGCKDNIDPIEFAKVNNLYNSPFNEKHKHCRNCAEQKILQDITGGNMLADGRPGKRPGHPSQSPPDPTLGGSGTGGISGSTQAPSKVPATTTPTKTYSINNECDIVLEKMSNYWDCTKTDNKGNPVCNPENGTTSSNNDDFYTLFEKWVDLFLTEHEIFKNKMEQCKTRSGQNQCNEEDCTLKCYCYNKWLNRRKKEWKKQKMFYDAFNIKTNSVGDLGFLGNLDFYFKLFFKNRIHNALGRNISLQEQEENSKNKDEIIQIIMNSQELIDECMSKCPKKLECYEKGFKNEWECDKTTTTASSGSSTETEICLKRGDNKYEKENMNKVDNINRFYDSFEEWIDYMEKSINEKMKILKQSCHTTHTLSRNSGSGSLNCDMCNDDCKCYDIWKGKIDKQWKSLKDYYQKYQNSGSGGSTSGTYPMKDIDLNIFLEALCETKYGDNSDQDGICTKLKGNKTNFVEGLLDKNEDKKKSVCDVCKEGNKYDQPVDTTTCNAIKDLESGLCNTKNIDGLKSDGSENKPWVCRSNKNSEFEKDVCVSPRTQSLCVANMYTQNRIEDKAFSDKNKMNESLKKAIKTETKLLWNLYSKNGSDNDKACRLTHRSFNDFKHMVIGDIPWKAASFKAIGDKIKDVLKNGGKGGSGSTTPQDWWEEHSDNFWNAVKCGIKEASGNATSCPRLINDDDQFEWWAKEWSGDFYEKRKELVDKVEVACKVRGGCNGASGQARPSGDCGTKCTQYKTFLEKKRNEWTLNFKNYLEQQEEKQKKGQNKNSSDDEKTYMVPNYYLLYPCTYNSCYGKHIKDLLGDKDYGELQNKCKCDATSSKKEEEANPCSGDFTHYGCNEKKYDLGLWSSTYVTNPQDRGKVFAPPRRNSICIGWLFSPISETNKDKAKEELKEKVIDAARGEAHYLHKYYKEKQAKNSGSPSGTDPPPVYCDALKRSFEDIGDMVKGTDMWSGGYSELVEQNIQSIFQLENDGTNGKLIKTKDELLDERKQWWNTIREDVWEAMNCKDANKCDVSGGIPDDDKKPQFLRWLEEWSEHMCEERDKQIKHLEKACKNGNDVENDKTCDKGSEDCKKQCKKYNSWITTHKNEWLGQKSKYEAIFNDKFYDNYEYYQPYINDNADANTYIKKQCKSCDKCKSGSTNVNLDSIFNKTDDDYKEYEPFCTTCRINDIAEKAKENSRINPCGDKSGKHVRVKKVAKTLQQKANEEAKGRLDGTLDKLKGKLSEAIFKNNNSGNYLKEEICKLKKETHTNDSRSGGEPCKGKGTGKSATEQRFAVGLKWKPEEKVEPQHKEVLFPPRRLDMCTSNLEYLDVNKAPGLTDGNKAIHSLLGDVLLTAKYEANQIIELYKIYNLNGQDVLKVPKDKQTICQAMKNSFADIGDIIRGRDIWTKNGDMQKIENNLEKIFENIKEKHSDDTIKKNLQYINTDKYKKMREDWWKANRDQVWKAMKCSDTTNICSDSDTPHEDYIPQKLRWLTEWSEWYCKRQSQVYKDLEKECGSCKKNKTTGEKCSNEEDCGKCQTACGNYKSFIDDWKQDWEKQKTQYTKYYQEAQKNNGNNGKDENEKYLNKFLHTLQSQNSGNNTYGSAEGYVHEVLKDTGCEKQNEFCENKPSGGGKNEKYAFNNPPEGYSAACSCNPSTVPQAPQATSQENICEKVKGYITENETETVKNKRCNKKDNKKTWNCTASMFENNQEGPCMPPRRQTLCIYYLQHMTNGKNAKEDELKTALIKCASLETYYSWLYYKQHSGNKDAEQKLKNGTIPEDFKRQMFYTYSDFRDLVLGTDIYKRKQNNKNNAVGTTIDNINKIFNKNGGTKNEKNQTKEQWWDTIKEDVWKAMVCSLRYDEKQKTMDTGTQKQLQNGYQYGSVTFGDSGGTDLTTFVERPQFLRWMTEWGEHFCREQKKQLDILEGKCNGCNPTPANGTTATCDESKCKSCKDQCNTYKTWLNTWKGHYTKQKTKYSQVKNEDEYTSADSDVKDSTDARQYLQKKLKDLQCTNKTSGTTESCNYKCMDEKSSTGDTPKSMDYPPSGYKDKCECTPVEDKKPQAGSAPTTSGVDTKDSSSTSSVPPGVGSGNTQDVSRSQTVSKNASAVALDKDKDKKKKNKKGKGKKGKTKVITEIKRFKIPNRGSGEKAPKAAAPNVQSDTKIVNGSTLTTTISFAPSPDTDDVDDPTSPVTSSEDDEEDTDDEDTASGSGNTSEPVPAVSTITLDPATQKVVDQGTSGTGAAATSSPSSSTPSETKNSPNSVSGAKADASPGALGTATTGQTGSPDPVASVNGGSGGEPSPTSPSPSPSTQRKNQDTKSDKQTKPIPAPKDPLNCVDEAAYYVGKEAENALDKNTKLKGSDNHNVYKTQTTGSSNGNSCKINDTTAGQNDTCKNNENPFNDIDKWSCDKKTKNVPNQDICFPPRKHMCLTTLQNLEASTTTSDELFKNVLLTAAYEGKHLKEKWDEMDKKQNTTASTRPSIKRYELCDAMRYSFADLGDIIRGRDILIRNNGKDKNIEEKLKSVFKNIQENNADIKSKYPLNADTKYTKLREAWWDTNRKEIWKAMTFCAPENFYIVKRGKGDGSDIEFLSSSNDKKCGHENDPPYDDYIPQVFRWISEWSEHFCLYQNHLLETMRNCANCKTKNEENKNCEQIKHGACKDCKRKCDKYKEFVDKWKKQYDVLEKAYKNVYNKEIENYPKSSGGTNTNDSHIKYFVEKLKDKCKNDKSNAYNTNTIDKYLDKKNGCRKLKFDENQSKKDDYAFSSYPKEYKNNCVCANNFDPLDACPLDEEDCNKYRNGICRKKDYDNSDNNKWYRLNLKIPPNNNKGTLIPPRRRHLCLKHNIKSVYRSSEEEKFKHDFFRGIALESKSLSDKYSKEPEKALQAMKYNFADIGNIIKGNDMLDDLINKNIDRNLNRFFKKRNVGYNETDERKKWWENNKEKVWTVMMCEYKGGDKTSTTCPSHDNIDKEPQFLRWFKEWAAYICKEKKKKITSMKDPCMNFFDENRKIFNTTISDDCKPLLDDYIEFVNRTRPQWNELKEKYIRDKQFNNSVEKIESTPQEYLANNCTNCDCNLENLEEIFDRHKRTTYQILRDILKKEKEEYKDKILPKTNIWNDLIYPLFNISVIATSGAVSGAKIIMQKTKELVPNVTPKSTDIIKVDDNSRINNNTHQTNKANKPFEGPNIMIPAGIGAALTMGWLLFKNDYGIPDKASTNRYIPYGQYKGKTYIYVEGEETDDYIRDISSTDVTSSDSEYEEMDINDIYPYKSPKYKTLIEVVLKPSNKTYDAQDTHTYHMEDTSDTTTKKLTDNEWNELKQDFILNMLQNDIPDENVSGNICMDPQPDIVDNTVREKPFITSIQDRKLYCDNEITYNIEWNVPENINRTTNNLDDQKYVSSNDKYSGIDLINDSLNNDQHVDIYDELLKRKENELFGTKYTKTSSRTNSAATKKHNDSLKIPNRFM